MARQTASPRLLAAVLALGCGLPAVADAAEPDWVSRTRPPRYAKATADVPRPTARRPLPEDLLPRAPAAVPVGHDHPGLRMSASAAADEAAAAAFRRSGRREVYRVGFFEALQEVLAHPQATHGARLEGERAGAFDDEAVAAGALEGRTAAVAQARSAAEAQVARAYRDLSREPRFAPRLEVPSHVAPLPAIPRPRREAVLADLPLREFVPSPYRFREFLDGWELDGRALAACASSAEFSDPGWRDPTTALSRWLETSPGAVAYRRLAPPERRRFVHWFRVEFASALAARSAVEAERWYGLGYDDGWVYGALANEELAFRVGYASGLARGFAEAARSTFDRSYPRAYERAYAETFDAWSREVRAEIVAVRLEDAGRDGVFEPGEGLQADYELINYGGGSGTFEVRLDGGVLARSAAGTVRVPPRSRVRADEPLRARIRSSAAPRSVERVDVLFADQVATRELRVAYPLEFERDALRIRRDDLQGALQVDLGVVNNSGRPLDFTVGLSAAGIRLERPVARLEGLQASRVSFDLRGLPPLDLMAGEVSLDLGIEAEGVRHDDWRRPLRSTVSDLGNRDLLAYMFELAGKRDARDAEIEAARRLMRLRLREDWEAAARGRGNPYKADYRRGSGGSALGDLVSTYRARRSEIVEPGVFEGIGADIAALAGDLPGAHPFLRRSFKRLAGRLP